MTTVDDERSFLVMCKNYCWYSVSFSRNQVSVLDVYNDVIMGESWRRCCLLVYKLMCRLWNVELYQKDKMQG
jgi:hypothetical protein